jgi:hypothetical protein
LEFVRYLIQQKRCDANYTDIEDQTPLHHTCGWLSECTEEDALTISKYLVTKARCDPTGRDTNGKTGVLHACEKGFLMVLKYFIEDRNCDLSVVDFKGNNALHLAVSFSNNCAVVEYIISKNVVGMEATNNSGNNVLHMAAIAKCSLDVCRLILEHDKSTLLIESLNENGLTPLDLANDELLHYVLTRFQIHSSKFYEKYALSLGVKLSPTPQMRVFVIGDSKSGKTALINSLQKEVSSFSLSFSSSHSPLPQLVEEVRGLVVTDFESKLYGHVTFYDFSDHVDYEYIQQSILQHSIYPAFSLLVIVVDQQKSIRDLNSSIDRWLSFASRAWNSQSNEKIKVIIAGSYADVIKASSRSHRNSGLKSMATDIFASTFSCFEFVSKIPVDCQNRDCSGMVSLRKQLGAIASKMEGKTNFSFNASCLLAYLKSKFYSLSALKVETLASNIRLYQLETGTIHDVRYFLSNDTSILIRLLGSLDEAGHVLLLKNEADVGKSVVITQAPELFADLSKLWNRGTISTDTDHQYLLSHSAMSAMFPDFELDTLHQILTHLNLCTDIDMKLETSSDEHVKRIYFPSLLPTSSPLYVWDPKCSYDHYYGWIIEGTGSFSLHFVHDVLSRCLSLSYSAVGVEDLSLWKSGMYFRSNSDGTITEILIEAFDNWRAFIFLMRTQRFSPSSLRHRSSITKEIRECLAEHTTESLIDPFDAVKYPLPARENLTLFVVSEVISSIQSNDTHVGSEGKFRVTLKDILYFEPYSFIGSECLTVLSKAPRSDLVSDELIRSIAQAMSSNIQMLHLISCIFSFTPTEFRPCSDELYSVLLSWNTRTYSDLVQLLDSYSVFSVTDFSSP